MKVDGKVLAMKDEMPEGVVLVKCGPFYRAYGKDASVLSFLCGYKVNDAGDSCGFPVGGLGSTLKVLEENGIGYVAVDKAKDYVVECRMDVMDGSRYMEVYRKDYKFVLLKKRIDAIYGYLIENLNGTDMSETVKKVEDLLFGE